MSVGERERATLARVVETFCPGAPSRAVADTIVAELEAVDRPKLVADLVLFLRVIERRTANLVLAGRPRPFSEMTRHPSVRTRYGVVMQPAPFPGSTTTVSPRLRIASTSTLARTPSRYRWAAESSARIEPTSDHAATR